MVETKTALNIQTRSPQGDVNTAMISSFFRRKDIFVNYSTIGDFIFTVFESVEQSTAI